MAESVDPPRRIVRDFFHMREHDARRAKCARNDSGFDDAVTYGARGLVPAPAHYRRSRRETGEFGRLRRDAAGYVRRFVALRENRAVQAEPVHHFIRPAPVHHIEYRRAGSIGGLRRELSCPPDPYV